MRGRRMRANVPVALMRVPNLAAGRAWWGVAAAVGVSEAEA